MSAYRVALRFSLSIDAFTLIPFVKVYSVFSF